MNPSSRICVVIVGSIIAVLVTVAPDGSQQQISDAELDCIIAGEIVADAYCDDDEPCDACVDWDSTYKVKCDNDSPRRACFTQEESVCKRNGISTPCQKCKKYLTSDCTGTVYEDLGTVNYPWCTK